MTMTSGESGAAGAPAAARPGAALRSPRILAGLDDRELLAIARSLPKADARRRARKLLVLRHRGLVRACVTRYRRSPEQDQDLMQVGYVGLALLAAGLFCYGLHCPDGARYRDRPPGQ